MSVDSVDSRDPGRQLDEFDATQERRRRTKEFGYRVCGLWEGDVIEGRPRICVMPKGHLTSPHRDHEGIDFHSVELVWPPSG